ncbi:NUDIX domain-containing protein [Bacillus sp. es.034]|uniref:NUDIX hydrolase n=1 Tax=Bacillus sp. es.034 TaxID=1761763 RepID=UPI000BF78315|nr:NUDIX domain-containing protein [Bacillus sp. es.034]PFG03522.1 8-oxo-dGTP diphosphatase [Bacillus sp. es.034]
MKKVFGEKVPGVEYQMRTGVYAVIFHHKKNKILTVRNETGHYFLPGGGMEENESDVECLEREMMEETGYCISIGSHIGNAMCYFFSRMGDPLLGEGHFFLVELNEKMLEPMEDEHAPVWMDRKDAKRLLIHEHHYWAIEEAWKLKEEIGIQDNFKNHEHSTNIEK